MPGYDPGPPAPGEYAPFYETYVRLVPDGPIAETLGSQVRDTLDILRRLSEAEADRPQPPYTWSFKEVVGHLADTERVMTYRAMRIARDDPTPLPGFDENAYVRAAAFVSRPLSDLAAEFLAVREATVWFFRNLDGPAWLRTGTANGTPVSVRALAHIAAGHERHHAAILRRRVAMLRSETFFA
jgi:hypothetical protein